MQTMISYEFGDVVLVPFPFTDQSVSKKRPAIVVSSSAYHRERQDIVLMAATSQIKPSASFGEVTIAQWEQAGLLKPSVIKPIFTTIEKLLVLRKLGRLDKRDRRNLQESLREILGEDDGHG
ncbi:MAG: type II toxin-antitoxin system PemK/MazF family toxin [bacterium]